MKRVQNNQCGKLIKNNHLAKIKKKATKKKIANGKVRSFLRQLGPWKQEPTVQVKFYLYPGSGKNLFRIPDPGPGVKMAPDSASATLKTNYCSTVWIKNHPTAQGSSYTLQVRVDLITHDFSNSIVLCALRADEASYCSLIFLCWLLLSSTDRPTEDLKVVTNEKGEAVGELVTIIC